MGLQLIYCLLILGKVYLHYNTALSGPLTFQNQLSTFYDDIRRKINEQFIFFIRDSTRPESEKRAIIERFVHLPFVMPPTLSLDTFSSIADYFELCYWIELISSYAKNSGSNNIIGNNRTGSHYPRTINDRLLALTGHHLAYIGGGAEGSEANVFSIEKGMVLRRTPGSLQSLWTGYCSREQVEYANKIMLPAARKSLLSPFFVAQGNSSQSAFG